MVILIWSHIAQPCSGLPFCHGSIQSKVCLNVCCCVAFVFFSLHLMLSDLSAFKCRARSLQQGCGCVQCPAAVVQNHQSDVWSRKQEEECAAQPIRGGRLDDYIIWGKSSIQSPSRFLITEILIKFMFCFSRQLLFDVVASRHHLVLVMKN